MELLRAFPVLFPFPLVKVMGGALIFKLRGMTSKEYDAQLLHLRGRRPFVLCADSVRCTSQAEMHDPCIRCLIIRLIAQGSILKFVFSGPVYVRAIENLKFFLFSPQKKVQRMQ